MKTTQVLLPAATGILGFTERWRPLLKGLTILPKNTE